MDTLNALVYSLETILKQYPKGASMSLLLGIDTGGTYTDAVIFEDDGSGVQKSAKAITTKNNLALCIREAAGAVLPGYEDRISMVSLSTTLATNAIVEGYRSPVCVILIGYTEDILLQEGLKTAIDDDPVLFIRGGHTATGEEQEPLDSEGLRAAIISHREKVKSFAISGYFGVLNPEHELKAKALVEELSGLPATCGHTLTTNLHAARRALTTVFNARLIPIITNLIGAVQSMLDEYGVHAPLMVVKGDGSLISASLAMIQPVETILSGPAASVVGATFLSGEKSAIVSDMGGTTTDIAILTNGRPLLNKEGAEVGGYKTMVEAVSIHTYGLGGDSEVHFDGDRRLLLGPKRVIPTSLLVHQHPETLDTLLQQEKRERPNEYDGKAAVLVHGAENEEVGFTSLQLRILKRLEDGPGFLEDLVQLSPTEYVFRRDIQKLVHKGYITLSGVTPTDAAHVLGLHDEWSVDAAEIGLSLSYRKIYGEKPDRNTLTSFAQAIFSETVVQSASCLVSASLSEQAGIEVKSEPALLDLLTESIRGTDNTIFSLTIDIKRPIIAIGAPVHVYYPHVAEKVKSKAIIPEYASIANAIGAVAGGIHQESTATISPILGEVLRVFHEKGTSDYETVEEAVSAAKKAAAETAEEKAIHAGAKNPAVDVSVKENRAPITGGGDTLIDIVVTARASGRPGI